MRRNFILGESACPALTNCLMVMVCRRVVRCRLKCRYCIMNYLLRVRIWSTRMCTNFSNDDYCKYWQENIHMKEEKYMFITWLSQKGKPKLRPARIFAGLDWVELGPVLLPNTISFYIVLSTRYYCYCPWLILLHFSASPRGRSQYSYCTAAIHSSGPQQLLAFWLLSHLLFVPSNSKFHCWQRLLSIVAVDSSTFPFDSTSFF